MYEMGRGHVYLVRSVPARAVFELRWRAASAGGEKPPPSGSWMMISTSFFLLIVRKCERSQRNQSWNYPAPVSYTHLTLPTICSV